MDGEIDKFIERAALLAGLGSAPRGGGEKVTVSGPPITDENDQIRVRREKARPARRRRASSRIRRRIRSRTRPSEAVAAFQDDAPAVAVAAAGRVVARRKMGRATFLHLLDRTGRLQVYSPPGCRRRGGVRAAGARGPRGFRPGSPAPCSGPAQGEVTLQAQQWTFLGRPCGPLPEKWHGLADKEIRFRQRYLDLVVNEDARRAFQARSRVIAAMRRVLDAKGLSGSRDADPPAHSRRRHRASLPHAAPRARHHAVPADRERAVPQALSRGWARARVRVREGLPQRGHGSHAPARVHDGGDLPGLRELHCGDGAHRGAARRGLRGGERAPRAGVPRPHARLLASLATHRILRCALDRHGRGLLRSGRDEAPRRAERSPAGRAARRDPGATPRRAVLGGRSAGSSSSPRSFSITPSRSRRWRRASRARLTPWSASRAVPRGHGGRQRVLGAERSSGAAGALRRAACARRSRGDVMALDEPFLLQLWSTACHWLRGSASASTGSS